MSLKFPRFVTIAVFILSLCLLVGCGEELPPESSLSSAVSEVEAGSGSESVSSSDLPEEPSSEEVSTSLAVSSGESSRASSSADSSESSSESAPLSSEIPSEMPSSLPLNVIFTVDVEDKRGSEPNLIEGDLTPYGIKENCGVNYIMDTFEKYNARAVFFVNIFEQELYEPGYMPSLLRRIDSRGHEVGLHSHMPEAESSLREVYSERIDRMTEEEQIAFLTYGRNYIFDVTGKYPVSYRSGAYRTNDTLFAALEKAGFFIDSSLYYGNEGNQFERYRDLKNQTVKIGKITEFPVIVLNVGSQMRKLDIDSLKLEKLREALEAIRQSGQYETVQIMFHSFSFLDQSEKGRKPLLTEQDKVIYGEDSTDKNDLEELLRWLTNSEDYRVITFRDYLAGKHDLPAYTDDNMITLP